MDKRIKNEFPQVCNKDLSFWLNGKARGLVMRFTGNIIPILRKFGICNDETISRIMFAESREAIYREALRINGEARLSLMEDIALSNDVDIWKPLRALGCKVFSPMEPGFVFSEMPLSDEPKWIKEKLAKAITVKNGKLFLSDDIIEKESAYIPTDKQRELYDILKEFCDRLQSMGIKCDAGKLFVSRYNDYLRPNVASVLYFHIGRDS